MTNFINNSANLTERRGLYCVWVPARHDGNAPLISIWIDPKMTAFSPPQESPEPTGVSGDTVSEEIEDHLQRIPSARGTWHSFPGNIPGSERQVARGSRHLSKCSTLAITVHDRYRQRRSGNLRTSLASFMRAKNPAANPESSF